VQLTAFFLVLVELDSGAGLGKRGRVSLWVTRARCDSSYFSGKAIGEYLLLCVDEPEMVSNGREEAFSDVIAEQGGRQQDGLGSRNTAHRGNTAASRRTTE